MELALTVGGWGLAIVVALIALLPRKGTVENTRIDQLQQDLEAERAERKALSAEVKTIRTEMMIYQKRDLIWSLHYETIKRGVEDGTIPPWPNLPDVLRGSHE